MTEESTDHSAEPGSVSELEESLLQGSQDDARLGSGVQDTPVDSDLTFINMTGLVGPESEATVEYSDSEMDPEAPVSFYEEGVDDVDAGMDPTNTSILDTEDVLRAEAVLEDSAPSASLAELQGIITELEQPEPGVVEPEPVVEENEVINSAVEATRAVENLTAQNLEAASESLDTLNVPINTELAEMLADAADRLNEHDAANPIREPEAPKSEFKAGVNLDEAESLLNELEAQDRDVAAESTGVKSKEPHHREKVPITDIRIDAFEQPASEELDGSVYKKPPLPLTTPRHKHRRKRSITLAQMLLLLIILGSLVVLGVFGVNAYRHQTKTPQELLMVGNDLIAEGEFRAASEHFSTRVPEPVKDQASFLAAYALQLIPVSDQGPELSAYHASVEKFEAFILEYPEHEKVPRAETLLGILYFKVGRTSEAIRVLSDPRRRLRDPGGYLPSLRILAQIYAENGDMEKAHQLIMQVVNLTENITPDKDLITLASMFIRASEQTSNKQDRIDDMNQAVTILNQAVQLPAVLKMTREELETQRDYYVELIADLESTEGETVSVLKPVVSEASGAAIVASDDTVSSGTEDVTELPSAVVVNDVSPVEETMVPETTTLAEESETVSEKTIETPTESAADPKPNNDALELNSLRIPEDL